MTVTEEKKAFIYALSENNSKKYRYVGKTLYIEKRLKNHIYNSKFLKTYKDNWIQKCLKNNKKVTLTVLEEVDNSIWEEREKYWIHKLKENGCDLTNHNNGGLGGGVILYTKPYEFIKKWVKNNLPQIKSAPQWYDYTRDNELPDDISANPKEVYAKRGWIGWGDFLGTGRISSNYVNYFNYNEAKKWIQDNMPNIKTTAKWKKTAKTNVFPNFIPNRPERYYAKRGWVSWGDFLETMKLSNRKRKFISYKEAELWILKNKPEIKTATAWLKFVASGEVPIFLPRCPYLTYKSTGWISWNEFLNRVIC
jgi:hypothetical protein